MSKDRKNGNREAKKPKMVKSANADVGVVQTSLSGAVAPKAKR